MFLFSSFTGILMKHRLISDTIQRQRRIEAINGTWAMIGLTVGLVIEGQAGNGILAQVCYYLQNE